MQTGLKTFLCKSFILRILLTVHFISLHEIKFDLSISLKILFFDLSISNQALEVGHGRAHL